MYIYCGCILKIFLLIRFVVKKFGDHWSKLPCNKYFGMCIFVVFFILLPFPIGKPLHSLITLYLKYQEQSGFHFCF